MMLTREKPAGTLELSPEHAGALPSVPEPGDVLDERFLILEVLSEGGTSRVLKATDLEAGDLVAIKVPSDSWARDSEFLERFRREEEIGLSVRHPYLARARHVHRKSRPYIALEYAKGETLGARLARSGRLGESEAIRIADMVLSALEALHARGIVHRDVTPKNIFLSEDGTVRLLDLGIASDAAERDTSGAAEEWLWGTPAYMAPERVRNERGDPRSDLYSLGIVLYEMLTGSVPFVGEDPEALMNARLSDAPVRPRTLRPELDPGLEGIILRALALAPDERYASAAHMREELEGLSEGRPGAPKGRRSLPMRSWLGEHLAEVATAFLLVLWLVKAMLELRSP